MSLVLRVMSDAVPKCLYPGKDRSADIGARPHCDSRRPVHRDDGARPDQERENQHDLAGAQDVVEIPINDAVVDDVGVEIGQVEVPNRLGDEEGYEHGDLARVRAQVGAKQAGQHGTATYESDNGRTSPVLCQELIDARTAPIATAVTKTG